MAYNVSVFDRTGVRKMERKRYYMENNLVEIQEFINQWKERARKFIPEAIAEYKARLKKVYEIDMFNNRDQYLKAKRTLINDYPAYIRDFATGYSEEARNEKIEKFIQKEAEAKEKTLIARVNKAVGLILEANNLYVGVDGELNGFIKGENGTCKVESIYAGGYNIQCLHYRVLVKKLK